MQDGKALTDEIARLEARLHALAAEEADLRSRIEDLRAGGGCREPAPVPAAASPTLSRRERVALFVDRDVPILARMFEKRLRGYRRMGYSAEPKHGDARLPGL